MPIIVSGFGNVVNQDAASVIGVLRAGAVVCLDYFQNAQPGGKDLKATAEPGGGTDTPRSESTPAYEEIGEEHRASNEDICQRQLVHVW